MRGKVYDQTFYHGTAAANVPRILKEGIKVNRIGCCYVSPKREVAEGFGEVVLEVRIPRSIRLSAFDDCADWEVLCWGKIPASGIRRPVG